MKIAIVGGVVQGVIGESIKPACDFMNRAAPIVGDFLHHLF